jgi:hypothetical protein
MIQDLELSLNDLLLPFQTFFSIHNLYNVSQTMSTNVISIVRQFVPTNMLKCYTFSKSLDIYKYAHNYQRQGNDYSYDSACNCVT